MQNLGPLALTRGPETLVLYRTRPLVSCTLIRESGGARPIQLFEGSRRGGSVYANSMVLP